MVATWKGPSSDVGSAVVVRSAAEIAPLVVESSAVVKKEAQKEGVRSAGEHYAADLGSNCAEAVAAGDGELGPVEKFGLAERAKD